VSSLFGVNVNFLESGKQGAPLLEQGTQGTARGTIPVVSNESFIEINMKEHRRSGSRFPTAWSSKRRRCTDNPRSVRMTDQ